MKNIDRILKNLQAQIALQQEALNIVHKKAGALLDRTEKEQINICQTGFAALLDQNRKLLEEAQ